MEKKFDFTLPKFMAKRKTLMKKNDESNSSSLNQKLINPGIPKQPKIVFPGALFAEKEESDNFVESSPKFNAGLPSFFQHSFSPAHFSGTTQPSLTSPTPSTPVSPFTPRKFQSNSSACESSHDQSSYHLSPDYSNNRNCRTPSFFRENCFAQPSVRKTQLFKESKEQIWDSSDKVFAVSKPCDILHRDHQEGVDMDSWGNGHLNIQQSRDMTAFERQVHSLADQLLTAADRAKESLVAENVSLRKELNTAENQIMNLKMKIERMTASESKAADRANALFAEGENLREKLKVFETQTSTSRDILRDIERQLKETSLQLKSKELALKAANESVTSLEKLILTSDQQLSSLQIRFQVVSTARAAADEKSTELSVQVQSLNEKILQLQSHINDTIHELRSTISTCENKLEKEKNAHSNTEAALRNTNESLESVKEELAKCTEKYLKVEETCLSMSKEKLQTEERFNDLQIKHQVSEQKLLSELENASLLNLSLNTVRVELNLLKQELEVTSAEFAKITEKGIMLDDENRSLHSQLETLRDQMNTSEEKFLSDLNESKQSLYSERMEHKETKMHLDACRQQLEESKSQSSLELTKIQSEKDALNDQKSFLEEQANGMQLKLVTARRNLESAREESQALKRRLELNNIEISTLKIEAQKESSRNNELQAFLDDTRMKSALSQDELKAEVTKYRKELDSQREKNVETLQHLTGLRDQLSRSEKALDEAISNQSQLQTDMTILEKDKLVNEDTIKELQNKISAQQLHIEAIKSSNASINETLNVYERFISGMQQKFRLIVTEHREAMVITNDLMTEIKTLQTDVEINRKSAEIVDEDVKCLSLSFNKYLSKADSCAEIKKLLCVNSDLISLNENLKKLNNEQSQFEVANRALIAEKEELEKQLEKMKGNLITSKSVHEKLHDRNITLQEMITASSQQILDLQNQIQTTKAEADSFRDEVNLMKNENMNLETRVNFIRNESKTSEERFKKDLESLSRLLEDERAVNKDLQSRLSSSEGSNSCLKAELDHCRMQSKLSLEGCKVFSENPANNNSRQSKQSQPELSRTVDTSEILENNNFLARQKELDSYCSPKKKGKLQKPKVDCFEKLQSEQSVIRINQLNFENRADKQFEDSNPYDSIVSHETAEEKGCAKRLNKEKMSTQRRLNVKSLTAYSFRTHPRQAAESSNESVNLPLLKSEGSSTNHHTPNTNVQVSQHRERRKLFQLPKSPVEILSPDQMESTLPNADKSQHCLQDDLVIIEDNEVSFPGRSLEPIQKTYARKRSSVTSSVVSTPRRHPAITPKKTRRSTK